VPALCAQALAALDLARLGALQTRFYSGGNRRRLSLAVAYVAAPRVVMLDEASTGVDPAARRLLFDAVRAGRAGRATVATSHVIEEADALCSRVGILVDGRLAAVGAPARVKRRFGGGFVVDVTFAPALDDAACAASAAALARALPAAVAECAGARARLDAPPTLALSAAFATLGAARARGELAEFGVSAASLESVFLRFARAQEAADERDRAAARAAGPAGARAWWRMG